MLYPILMLKNAIKANGNNPKMKKKINPGFIILYIKPLSVFNSIWPHNVKKIAKKNKASDTIKNPTPKI